MSCPECGGSGEWVNPFNNAASPCSLGCKKRRAFEMTKERLDAFDLKPGRDDYNPHDNRLTKIALAFAREAEKARGFINDYGNKKDSSSWTGGDRVYTGRVIGGPAHGQTVSHWVQRYEVFMPSNPKLSYVFDTTLFGSLAVDRFAYRREQFMFDGEKVPLWVPADWPHRTEGLCLRVFEELFKRSLKSGDRATEEGT